MADWTLPAQVTHLHLVSLDRLPADLALLSPGELRRGEKLLDRRRADFFVRGRSFLRTTLGRYLGMAPQRVVIVQQNLEKPALEGGGNLRFNLSHAGGLLLLAVGRERELGVDIEEVREELEFEGMARRFFSPAEQASLFALPAHLRREAFFRGWVRKEAYLKGCGSGFRQPSDCFDVSLLPGEPLLREHRLVPEETLRWSLADLGIGCAYAAALAVEGPQPRLAWMRNDLDAKETQ